jgi:hypothetical protein
VVPEPEKGSSTVRLPFAFSRSIRPRAQTAENPAEYLNHRWMGKERLPAKVEVVSDFCGSSSVTVSYRSSCLAAAVARVIFSLTME